MKQYLYNGQLYSGKELAELSGVKYTTLMERIKRGYSVEEAIADGTRVPESILVFCDEYDPADWNGLENGQLYMTYRAWCIENNYIPETQVHFSRSLKRQLGERYHIVPTRVTTDGVIKYKRLIRIY